MTRQLMLADDLATLLPMIQFVRTSFVAIASLTDLSEEGEAGHLE